MNVLTHLDGSTGSSHRLPVTDDVVPHSQPPQGNLVPSSDVVAERNFVAIQRRDVASMKIGDRDGDVVALVK
ncbi:hypothetical protein AAFP30_06860 [Gordonia sp. CPCC 205515]